jgi:prepilin-type N-terminal cleavage/methylation domain-containing protein
VQKQREQGFTLIELSMVLVIMGLILGMVFKGKSLVEQAKTKSVQSQLHKIQLSVESFRQQYGYWPGDGCGDEGAIHCNGEKNGYLEQKIEREAFWQVLIRHQLLTEQDRRQAFGKPWEILMVGDKASGIHQITTLLPVSQACLLDRQMDDGAATTGGLQMQNQTYLPQTQCTSLEGEGVMSANL